MREVPGILIFRSSATLYFANAEMYQDALDKKVSAYRHTHTKIQSPTLFKMSAKSFLRINFVWKKKTTSRKNMLDGRDNHGTSHLHVHLSERQEMRSLFFAFLFWEHKSSFTKMSLLVRWLEFSILSKSLLLHERVLAGRIAFNEEVNLSWCTNSSFVVGR